jgi:tetratricopeptide (TPR) repeat protein
MSAAAYPAARPAWVDDLFTEAEAARLAGRHALALAIYRRVLAAEPEHVAALQHLGALLTLTGRPDEGEGVLRRALALAPEEPNARHALGTALLAQGRFSEAWPHYEARFEIPQLGIRRPGGLPYPAWRGEDLAGKRILIFPEMGFGDQIQHARFALTLRDRGAAAHLFCAPELERLFAASLDGVEVAAASGQVEFPDPDYWTTCATLMTLVGVTPETLPNAPYLRAPQPGPARPPGFRVGVMTAGNPKHANDANRSLSPELAEQLRARLPGAVVELAPAASGARDFADTAAIIESLDLVVTVDTAVAHLTGALGKPGLLLAPAFGADWRWMLARADSPWYPSLTLYRSDRRAGWAPALERLIEDVRVRAAGG